ncbi:unnamed protein product [Phytophthora fragariaefolia]|uniref:Unnamed protein product n=1 Tax=Phytophthora fragariaefolia TaxID=1490495 RepID=A0A9W7CNY8_9STRA|nr:unnamed protein product [Phytophthora fragariaefolia]
MFELLTAKDEFASPYSNKLEAEGGAIDDLDRNGLRLGRWSVGLFSCWRDCVPNGLNSPILLPLWLLYPPLTGICLCCRVHGLPVPRSLRGSDHCSTGTRALPTGAAGVRGAVSAPAADHRDGLCSAQLVVRGSGSGCGDCRRPAEDEDANAVRHPGKHCAGPGQRIRVRPMLGRTDGQSRAGVPTRDVLVPRAINVGGIRAAVKMRGNKAKPSAVSAFFVTLAKAPTSKSIPPRQHAYFLL